MEHQLDPLDRDTLLPYFQPILSVADGRIFGYEVLARQKLADNIVTLGPYLQDERIPLSERLAADRIVREKAVEKWVNAGQNEKLFINIFPSRMLLVEESSLPSLELFRKYQVNSDQIVIEVIEEDLREKNSVIPMYVERYRKFGCKIAIDDFYFNSFDRLIQLRPDFVKIDIRLMKLSVKQEEYKKIINYISQFSQELGVSVLFEGVETETELESAIESGASYIQGYFFSEARDDFQESSSYREKLKRSLFRAVDNLQNENRNAIHVENELNDLLKNYFSKHGIKSAFKDTAELDQFLRDLCRELPPFFFKAYICDHEGTQKSSNLMKNEVGECEVISSYRGKNWGWRPYFFYNVVHMSNSHAGVLSGKYIDVVSKKETVTFSYPLTKELFLFLDFYYSDAR